MKLLSFLQSKFLLLVLWGFFGFYIITGDIIRLEILDIEVSEDLIRDKPKYKYTIKDNIDVLDDAGNILGSLNKNVIVYSDKKIKKTSDFLRCKVFGWIWRPSIIEQEDVLILRNNENIRARINGQIIGRLNAGAILKKHYLNDTKKWFLFSSLIYVDAEKAQKIFDKKSLRSWLHSLPAIATITTKNGGRQYRGWISFGHILFLLPIAWILISITYLHIKSSQLFPQGKKVVFMEIFKAILQVLVGVAIATIVFVFGIK